MIPNDIALWTIEKLRELLEMGIFENETFDFKESLPDSRNEKEKDRVRKICAAFANSEGGFIIFGISDGRDKNAKERIVGVDASLDLPEKFGNFASACSPSINWRFRNPPIKLENDRVIHVISIPKSWKAPHAVSQNDGGFIFPKRTNKGNEFMNIEEIKNGYLGFYEKRIKIALLKSEITSIRTNAQELMVPQESWNTHHSLVTFDSSILNSVIADTYTVISQYNTLYPILTAIRNSTRILNNKIQLYFTSASMPVSNKSELNFAHNQHIAGAVPVLVQQCNLAIDVIDEILSR